VAQVGPDLFPAEFCACCGRKLSGRQEAKDSLKDGAPGQFVTRVSQSQPGHFALSVIQESGHYDHMLILPSYAGKEAGAPGNTRYATHAALLQQRG
jgi:hypothetical protein